ncbi:hypothetical protein RZN25_17615 [Bacillaceae bacterium S4-13-56]
MKSIKIVLFSLLVGLLIFSGSTSSVFAIQNSKTVEADQLIEKAQKTKELKEKKSNKTYEELSNEYGLKDISELDLPENAQVIKVDSVEEMELILESFNAPLESVSDPVIQEKSLNSSSTLSSYSSISYRTRTASEQLACCGKINISADFGISGSGSFYWIEDVKNIRTYASGFTYPFDWQQTGTPYSVISPGGLRATAYGSGVIEYYFLIEAGMFKVGQRDVDLSVTYSIG